MARNELWNIDCLEGSIFNTVDEVSPAAEVNPCNEVPIGTVDHVTEFELDLSKFEEYLENFNPSRRIGSLHADTAEDLISAWEAKQESKWSFFLPMSVMRPAGLIADDLVSVQPMSSPTGSLYYLDFRYQNQEISPNEIERL